MKLWLRIFAAVALATVFVISVRYFRPAPDPVFEGRSASQWAEQLLSADYRARDEAQAALKQLGEGAVGQLRILLWRRNPPWERYAARAASFLPFIHYRSYDSVLSRQRAAQVLAQLGNQGRAAIPELIECLESEALAGDAERALLRIGPESHLQLRRALLRHDRVAVRQRAARLLRESVAALPDETIEALLQAGNDRAELVRREAALSLKESSSGELNVDGALLKLLRDRSPIVRAAAAEALSVRSERGEAILRPLQSALADPSAQVRLEAAKSLWLLNADPEEVLPVLIATLKTELAWEAAYALGDMRACAAPAIPALIEALRKERVPRPFRTPPASAFALGQIGLSAIPALSAALEGAHPPVRVAAAMALGSMGRAAQPAADALLPVLDDPDAEVRHAAALALGRIGANSERVVTGLAACLHAEDIYMRFTAAELLREIAPARNWYALPE